MLQEQLMLPQQSDVTKDTQDIIECPGKWLLRSWRTVLNSLLTRSLSNYQKSSCPFQDPLLDIGEPFQYILLPKPDIFLWVVGNPSVIHIKEIESLLSKCCPGISHYFLEINLCVMMSSKILLRIALLYDEGPNNIQQFPPTLSPESKVTPTSVGMCVWGV